MLLKSLLIIFIGGCCCSFSAVPAVSYAVELQVPIKKKTKRQLRQEKRQQRHLLRLQKRQHRAQQTNKNHAMFNIVGFISAVVAPILVITGTLSLSLFGGISPVVLLLLGLGIAAFVLGIVFCIIGLVGSQNAGTPRKGFGIAGLIISGIPVAAFLLLSLLTS
jgi:hypothetical protein